MPQTHKIVRAKKDKIAKNGGDNWLVNMLRRLCYIRKLFMAVLKKLWITQTL